MASSPKLTLVKDDDDEEEALIDQLDKENPDSPFLAYTIRASDSCSGRTRKATGARSSKRTGANLRWLEAPRQEEPQ
jgi:hypothetical protein